MVNHGLFGRLYSPVHQALGFGENAVSAVTNTTRNVARRGIRGVNRVGKSATGRANAAIKGLLSRKRRGGASRKNRRNGASRKNRRNGASRKNRRNGASRKNRKNRRNGASRKN